MVAESVHVVGLVQARLGSERLPQKALLPLPFSGETSVLEHIISRASASSKIDTVVIATTEQKSDDPIAALCRRKDINCYRGNTENVLNRFLTAANQYQATIVVRLTGDNPFIQPDTIDQAVQEHIKNKVDYTITEGLPLGTNIEIVSVSALRIAAQNATEFTDLEHVTPFIRRSSIFNKQTLAFASTVPNLRLTIDYPSDYALASLIYDKLHQSNKVFNLDDVSQLLAEYPWLMNLNTQNIQKRVFSSESEEINEAIILLKKEGFSRIINRLN